MNIAVALFAIALFAAITAGWYFLATDILYFVKYLSGFKELSESGPWGDTFGAFNSLFSALGFAAVLTTLIIQGISLKRQQQDLHRQNFENTFFELLRMMRDARKEVEFEHSSRYLLVTMKSQLTGDARFGRSALTAAADEMEYWIKQQIKPAQSDIRSQLAAIYESIVHNKSEIGLGPYFRIIYTMLYRIKSDSILCKSEKFKYGNLLRSQLNSSELSLLGFNGLTKASKDLSDFLTFFRILKYLPQNQSRLALERAYPAETFAGRD